MTVSDGISPSPKGGEGIWLGPL